MINLMAAAHDVLLVFTENQWFEMSTTFHRVMIRILEIHSYQNFQSKFSIVHHSFS